MPPLGVASPRVVVTAVALGAAGTLFALLVVAAIFSQRDGRPDDPDAAFIGHVRPHLAISGWTDLQLLDLGHSMCDELERTEGDVPALIPQLAEYWKRGDYTDADLPRMQNDSAFILDGAIRQLCPEWIDNCTQQYRPTPPDG